MKGKKLTGGLFEFLNDRNVIPYTPQPLQCDFPEMMTSIFDTPTVTHSGDWTTYTWSDGATVKLRNWPLLDGGCITKPIKMNLSEKISSFISSFLGGTNLSIRECACGRAKCKGKNEKREIIRGSFGAYKKKLKTKLALDMIGGENVKIITDEDKTFEYSKGKLKTIIHVI